MDLIEAVTDDLIVDESFKGFIYDDATGKCLVKGDTLQGNATFGYGSRFIYENDAHQIMENRVKDIAQWGAVNKSWWQNLTFNRQRVICNMVYQLGYDGFAEFTDLQSCLSLKNFGGAADAMMNSLWAEECPVRARKYASLMLAG